MTQTPPMDVVRSDPANHDRETPGLFLKFANWVSEAMGKPANLAFWFVLVVSWTLVFVLGGPYLASGKWLPRWFTSTGYNFPLNLITTVAELFIGFLVAAAANRAQDALTVLLAHVRAGVQMALLDEIRRRVTAISPNGGLAPPPQGAPKPG